MLPRPDGGCRIFDVEEGPVVTLPLTPEMLAAAYDFLMVTPPFDKWSMPESDDVRFRVSRSRSRFGFYRWDGKRHTITVSINSVAYSSTLLETMSHEMVHLHLEELGMDDRGGTNTHSGAFRRLADDICKLHGFDPKAFY